MEYTKLIYMLNVIVGVGIISIIVKKVLEAHDRLWKKFLKIKNR